MSEPSKAIFLSYASQDAEAARRICEALRTGGIEVWFDQSELRGGDAWDRQIRKQIHDCALFIPIISATTQAREEGYFRREWRLANDRTHDRSDRRAFLVPVAIDDTGDTDADVPESFRAVQWTRLPAGETPPAFIARISQLLSPSETQGPEQAGASTGSAPSFCLPIPSAAASRRSRHLAALIAAVALLGVGYFAADKSVLPKRVAVDTRTLTGQVGAPAPSAILEKSVAVLPFADLSEAKDQEYFADGMAEEVINCLAKIPGLKVIGRTSSFQFKGKTGDLRTIGTTLGAASVVEGSVRRSGDQIRITAQLISARDGSQLWSQTYDRNSKNVLQLQEEIATAIARTLQVTITDYFKQQYTTRSPEAFDLYLRGVRDLDVQSAESARRAPVEFERASELDPKFVAAVIGQAFAYNELAGNAYMAPNEAYRRARLAIDRAITIDPRSADAHAVRALIRVNYDRDWDGAATDIAEAQELGGSRLAYLPAAKIAGARGDMARAAELYEAQLAIDPLDPESLTDLGWFVYPPLGRFDEADALLRRAHEADPDYTNAVAYFAGINMLLRGRVDEAAALIDAEKDVSAREALRAAVAHARGQPREADAAIARAIAAPNAWSWAIARTYAYRGDKPKALKWLDRAAADHDNVMWTVRTDPMLRGLEGETGFRAFLHTINVPD